MEEHICFNQDTSNHQHFRECLVCKVCFPILLDEWLIRVPWKFNHWFCLFLFPIRIIYQVNRKHLYNYHPKGSTIQGGGFKYFSFSPLLGERFPFWLIFFKRVETTNLRIINQVNRKHFIIIQKEASLFLKCWLISWFVDLWFPNSFAVRSDPT